MRSIRVIAAVAGVAVASVAAGEATISLNPWAAVAKIDAQKAPDAPSSPKRVFILTDILGTLNSSHTEAAAFGLELQKALEVRLDAQLRRCGVTVAGYATVGLDREEDVARQRAAFHADAVLIVRRMDRSQADEAVFLQAIPELWDVALEAVPGAGEIEGRRWWRAKVIFRADGRGARRAGLATGSMDSFVDQFVDRLKEDGFFPGCPAAASGELPSLAGPVASSRHVPITALRASGGLTVATFADPAARATAKAAESEASRQRGYGGATDAEPPPKGPSSDQLRGPIWGAGRTKYAPDLETYFKTAISAELGRMGISTSDPRRVLSGQIEDASADYSRWGFGCTVRVRFDVTDASTGQVVYSASKVGSSADRTMTEAGALDEALARCVEALAQDADFVRAIQ